MKSIATRQVTTRRTESRAVSETLDRAQRSTAADPGPLSALYAAALLGSGRGNAPVRQALLQQLQQTHGNRAVQRYLRGARCAGRPSQGVPLPIQRQVLVEEPAGGCGICTPPANTGTTAHTILESAFMSEMGGNAAVELRQRIPGSPTDENIRLDLAIKTPSGFEIGEIKPANAAGFTQGGADLQFYSEAIQNADPTGNTAVSLLTDPITPASVPGNEQPIDVIDEETPGCGQKRQQLFVNKPVGGVYGYFCRPTRLSLSADCCESKEQKKQTEKVIVLLLIIVQLMEKILEKGGQVLEGAGGLPPLVLPPGTPQACLDPPGGPELPGFASAPVAFTDTTASPGAGFVDVGGAGNSPAGDAASGAFSAGGFTDQLAGPSAQTDSLSAAEGSDDSDPADREVDVLQRLDRLQPPVPLLSKLTAATEQLPEGDFRDAVMDRITRFSAVNQTVCNGGAAGPGTPGPTPSAAHPMLRQGSRGSDVVELQQKLNAAGATPALDEDGVFGPLTRTAVVNFQQGHGLDPDGIVGPLTWGQLDQAPAP